MDKEEDTEWIASRREFEVDVNGKFILKKVTYDASKKKYLGLEKKEVVDLGLRIIGLIAIFVPVLLFYLGQQSERVKQKNLLQVETYTATTSSLHSLLKKSLIDEQYEEKKNILLYETGPKLALVGDRVVTNKFNKIRDHLNLYVQISAASIIADSVIAYYNDYNFYDEVFPESLFGLTGKTFESAIRGNRYNVFDMRSKFTDNINSLKRYEMPSESHELLNIRIFALAKLDSIRMVEERLNAIFAFKFTIESLRAMGKDANLTFGSSKLELLKQRYASLNAYNKELKDSVAGYAIYLLGKTKELDSLMVESSSVLSMQ